MIVRSEKWCQLSTSKRHTELAGCAQVLVAICLIVIIVTDIEWEIEGYIVFSTHHEGTLWFGEVDVASRVIDQVRSITHLL